jgi:hypothetical protein
MSRVDLLGSMLYDFESGESSWSADVCLTDGHDIVLCLVITTIFFICGVVTSTVFLKQVTIPCSSRRT